MRTGTTIPRYGLLFGLIALLWAPPRAMAGGSLETYGDVGQIAIPAIAAVVSAAKEDGEGIVQLAISAAATFATVQILKVTVDKERPNGGSESFPSGHTSGAFSGASYLHYRYGWEWGFPAYAAAALVGYSRVDADEHDWTDVIAGAAIANAFAFLLVDSVDDNVIVMPFIGGKKDRFGIVAKILF
jgi:membrane-associated phospholipid phosphatase